MKKENEGKKEERQGKQSKNQEKYSRAALRRDIEFSGTEYLMLTGFAICLGGK